MRKKLILIILAALIFTLLCSGAYSLYKNKFKADTNVVQDIDSNYFASDDIQLNGSDSYSIDLDSKAIQKLNWAVNNKKHFWLGFKDNKERSDDFYTVQTVELKVNGNKDLEFGYFDDKMDPSNSWYPVTGLYTTGEALTLSKNLVLGFKHSEGCCGIPSYDQYRRSATTFYMGNFDGQITSAQLTLKDFLDKDGRPVKISNRVISTVVFPGAYEPTKTGSSYNTPEDSFKKISDAITNPKIIPSEANFYNIFGPIKPSVEKIDGIDQMVWQADLTSSDAFINLLNTRNKLLNIAATTDSGVGIKLDKAKVELSLGNDVITFNPIRSVGCDNSTFSPGCGTTADMNVGVLHSSEDVFFQNTSLMGNYNHKIIGAKIKLIIPRSNLDDWFGSPNVTLLFSPGSIDWTKINAGAVFNNLKSNQFWSAQQPFEPGSSSIKINIEGTGSVTLTQGDKADYVVSSSPQDVYIDKNKTVTFTTSPGDSKNVSSSDKNFFYSYCVQDVYSKNQPCNTASLVPVSAPVTAHAVDFTFREKKNCPTGSQVIGKGTITASKQESEIPFGEWLTYTFSPMAKKVRLFLDKDFNGNYSEWSDQSSESFDCHCSADDDGRACYIQAVFDESADTGGSGTGTGNGGTTGGTPGDTSTVTSGNGDNNSSVTYKVNTENNPTAGGTITTTAGDLNTIKKDSTPTIKITANSDYCLNSVTVTVGDNMPETTSYSKTTCETLATITDEKITANTTIKAEYVLKSTLNPTNSIITLIAPGDCSFSGYTGNNINLNNKTDINKLITIKCTKQIINTRTVDGATLVSPGTYQYTFNNVGNHTITITDNLNSSTSSASSKSSANNTQVANSKPVLNNFSLNNQTSSSAKFVVAQGATVTLSGTATPNTTVNLTITNTTVGYLPNGIIQKAKAADNVITAQVVADNTGKWSYAAPKLTLGSYKVEAEVIDPNTNTKSDIQLVANISIVTKAEAADIAADQSKSVAATAPKNVNINTNDEVNSNSEVNDNSNLPVVILDSSASTDQTETKENFWQKYQYYLIGFGIFIILAGVVTGIILARRNHKKNIHMDIDDKIGGVF